MLVKAQAASNCNEGLSLASKHWTSTGKIPELISASIGGFLSEDNSFLAAWTAANWMAGSALRAFSTMVSKLAEDKFSRRSSSSVESAGQSPIWRFFDKVSSLLFLRSSTVTWERCFRFSYNKIAHAHWILGEKHFLREIAEIIEKRHHFDGILYFHKFFVLWILQSLKKAIIFTENQAQKI